VDSDVKLLVYTINGELVRELVNQKQSAGTYNVIFDGSNLSSGTYIYRLIANDFVQTKKMLLIK
jgi:flagellar hook assembly protein FlgD